MDTTSARQLEEFDAVNEEVIALTRDERRSRRKREVRAKTISIKRMSKATLELGGILYPEDTKPKRPKTRAECVNGPRPCAFVSCSYHLYLDVSIRTGAIKMNFPDMEVWEITESCTLDVAERDGVTLEEAGAILNVTRERVRQIEHMAEENCLSTAMRLGLHELVDALPEMSRRAKRRLPIIKEKSVAPEESDHGEFLPDTEPHSLPSGFRWPSFGGSL